MDYRFRWDDRLHRRADFTRVIRDGRRYGASGLILWTERRRGSDAGPRLGLAIPRTFGDAVRRNRLKRLLREVFRLHKQDLPRGVDLVFSARAGAFPECGGSVRRLGYPVVEAVVINLWKKAALLPDS